MEEFRLRRGSAADLDIVVHHRIEMFRDMGSTDDQLRAVQASAVPYFTRAFKEETYQAWFVEDASGRVVAGAGVNLLEYHPGPRDPQPRRPCVINVYTEPEFRQRGLARRVMEAIVEWCRANGYPAVTLHASEFGRPLYESLGFQPTNEMRLRFD